MGFKDAERVEQVRVVKERLTSYFNVLKDDGVISGGDVDSCDLEYLSRMIVDDMEEASIKEFEKWANVSEQEVPF